MAAMSAGTALRKLEQAQAGLRKARKALSAEREGGGESSREAVFRECFSSLSKGLGLAAEIPSEAASEDVLSRELAFLRYASALVVRLRRLSRNEGVAEGDESEDELEID